MTLFEEVHPQELRFLHEQDGRSERLLKQELILLFKESNSIEEAYLARCSLERDTAEEGIVLALRSASEVDKAIVERIQRVFASIFVRQEHLDILLMDANQERQVASVCLPFYQSVEGAQ